jgi:hypothetical protein
MDKFRERELRPPTGQQKIPVSNAMCLLQYSESLGVEWDGKILLVDRWETCCTTPETFWIDLQ